MGDACSLRAIAQDASAPAITITTPKARASPSSHTANSPQKTVPSAAPIALLPLTTPLLTAASSGAQCLCKPSTHSKRSKVAGFGDQRARGLGVFPESLRNNTRSGESDVPP